MAGFSSIDDFVTSVTTNGQFWRQDFVKLVATGTCIAGNCYDLWQGNGTIPQYYHGNLVSNYDLVSAPTGWVGITGTWSYTPATHVITRTASASDPAIYQTLRMVAGCYYYVRYTVARTAGTVTISLGGTAGTGRSTAGTFSEILLCGTTNKNLTITADSSYAGTVDLIVVQPIAGTFVPYTDLSCEGSMYHGGNVSPQTKHLVNMGACVNAASVPNVLYLVDVLGVYPRAIGTQTANYVLPLSCNSIRGAVLEDCQDDWNESAVADTAHSLVVKATEGVTGASANPSCVKLTVSNATFTTGVIGSEVVQAAGFSQSYYYQYAKYVYMWVRSTINLDAGDLTFCTDENASLASSQDTALPALTANTWTRVRLDVSGVAMADRDAVLSVGIKVAVDKNQGFSVYVDDVEWAMPDYVLQNGTFTGNADGWTVGTGWAYGSNAVAHSTAATATLEQTLCPLVQQCPYWVTYTVSGVTTGGVTVSIGGAAGTNRTTNGTFSEVITCGTTNYTVAFTPDNSFDGTIDNVICEAMMPRSGAGTATYGVGNKFYYVMDGTISNGAQTANVDIRYTNSSAAEGTHNRSLGGTVINMTADVVAHLPHSGVGAGKYGPFLPLQAGDVGVQSVDSISWSGAAATAESAVNVVVCKVIASIPITTAQVYAERDLMNQLPSLPRVRDGACLQLLHLAGAVTVQGTGIVGYCDFAWS